MKNLFTLALLIAAFSVGRAQDTIKDIPTVSVIGIRSINEPVSHTKIACDSVSFLNQQNDPFFILDKVAPSIYSQSDNGQGNGYSYLRMRGLDQTRINFNLNGIPLNEMEDQGIYFSNMPGFYNYLSRIDVQRGVGSSKYGNASIGGSVNMETRDLSKGGDLTYNTRIDDKGVTGNGINAFYSSGISKSLAVQVGASYLNNQGFREHSENEGYSIFYSVGRYTKHNILKVYGFSGGSKNQLAYYGVDSATLASNYRTNYNLESDRDNFKQNFVSANWVNFKLSKIKFNTSLYFNNVHGVYNSYYTDYGVNSQQYGILSNMLIEFKKGTINVGINGNLYSRDHFGSDFNGAYFSLDTTVIFQQYNNTGYKKDGVLYTKLDFAIDKEMHLFADIQGRTVSMKLSENTTSKTYNWNFINPKIGIKHSDGKTSTYAMIGYTQREPTRTDMIQNVIQRDSVLGGNPDNVINITSSNYRISPEKVIDLEIGNSFYMKKLKLNFNLYFMHISNDFLATGEIDGASGFMIKKNGESFRTGFESDGKYSGKLSFFYTFQYQHSKTIEYGHVTFAPNILASLGTSYKFLKHFETGVYDQYIGKMYYSLGSKSTSTPYNILNFYLTYTHKDLTLTGNVNNILNSKYFIPAGIASGSPSYYGGQTINFNLTMKFKF